MKSGSHFDRVYRVCFPETAPFFFSTRKVFRIIQIVEEALTLKPIDRIHLVEKLLISLNRPDPELEKEWAKESDARYEVYKSGEIEPVSLQHIRDTHS